MKNANDNTLTSITNNHSGIKKWFPKKFLDQTSFGKTAFICIAFLVFGITQLHSQEYLDLIHNSNENTTLQEIQSKAELYFVNRDKGRGSGYKQYKRWEYDMERKVNADGKILNFSKINWNSTSELNSTKSLNRSTDVDWTNLGPSSYTTSGGGYNGGLGRVNVVAFHPTDPDIIYLGTPAGGLWKSADGGGTWEPKADMLASIGISGIAVDHTTPSTLYVLTGDGDGAFTYSIGVLKSTDDGATWTTTGLTWDVTDFERGFKLLIHPTDSDIMFAATTDGLLKTTDGWDTWTEVNSGSFRDIEFKPGDPSIAYAVTKVSYYRSTDTGSSWTFISSSSAGLPAGESRAALAVTSADSDYVYYLAGPGGEFGAGTFMGLYRSTDAGLTFSTMATSPNILGYADDGLDGADQSTYDLAIAINPLDKDNSITGGINVWRSIDGGTSNTLSAHWYSPTAVEYVHADIHELVYNPLDNVLYCGSDGGISKSTDNGITWTNIWDGLEIMQFYRIAGVEADQDLMIGGTQDNGTNKYIGTATVDHILGADGMDGMIDYVENDILYYSSQFGDLKKSTDGGATSVGIKPAAASGAWVTPFAMDAADPSIIYGGYDDVYRSTDKGATWTNLGSDGTDALAVGVDDPARIYAAVGSSITTSADTGTTWTTITGSWPALKITDIAIDPADATKVWITLGGYTIGEKVYKSTDAGLTWTNITGGLPNSPAWCIAFQDTGETPANAIYIGMGFGVHYSSDSTPWTLYNSALPNVPIRDLEINHENCKIRAGTFGRGLWEAPLFGTPFITDIAFVDATCPGDSDAGISITALCTTCPGISYTITPTAPPGAPITQIDDGDFMGLPENEYEITVVNAGEASCVKSWEGNPLIITNLDMTAPVLICPIDQTHEVAAGELYELPDYFSIGEATVTDNCTDPVTITTQDPIAGSMLAIGVHTISFTAEDTNGNVSTCTFVLTIDELLGTKDQELDTSISIHPNPADHLVTITNHSNNQLHHGMVYDISGKIVLDVNLRRMDKEKVIDVSSFSSGMYFIKIISSKSSVVKQIIIK